MATNYLLTVTAEKLYHYTLRKNELEMVVELPACVDLNLFKKARLVFTSFSEEPVYVFATFCKAQFFGARPRRVLGVWPVATQPWVPLVSGLGNVATFTVLRVNGLPFS